MKQRGRISRRQAAAALFYCSFLFTCSLEIHSSASDPTVFSAKTQETVTETAWVSAAATTAAAATAATKTTATTVTEKTEPPLKPEPVSLENGFETVSTETELDLSGMDLSWVDMKAFLKKMPRLKRLTLKECGLDNDGYAALQDAFPDIRMIWNICVKGYIIPTDSVAFSALLADEYQPRLSDEDTKYFKYCTDMVALDLGHHHIEDLSFLEYMPNLKVLILIDNYSPYGTGRLRNISKLKYCPHLRYLELFANNISDMSVLSDLKELEDLNVCYNPVKSSAPFRDLPHLQKLWIYETLLTPKALDELRELYPDTTIVTEGYGSVDQGWREGEHYEAMRNMVINNVMDDVYK